jgi:Arc/MetJ-type ribon-helix-helix transcriptional regulator
MERNQINLRMSETLRKLIDGKRIELSTAMGTIPSRSDVLRFALELYFGQDLSKSEVDRRTLSKKPIEK